MRVRTNEVLVSRRPAKYRANAHLSLSSMVGSRSFASSMACTTSPCIIACRTWSSAKRVSGGQVGWSGWLMGRGHETPGRSTTAMRRGRSLLSVASWGAVEVQAGGKGGPAVCEADPPPPPRNVGRSAGRVENYHCCRTVLFLVRRQHHDTLVRRTHLSNIAARHGANSRVAASTQASNDATSCGVLVLGSLGYVTSRLPNVGTTTAVNATTYS